MLSGEWQGNMTKHQHVYKEEEVFVKFSIKYTSEGDVQDFLKSFQTKVGTDNLTHLFNYPVRWKKMSIDTSEYEKNYFTVGFDEIDFDAQLVDIQISRKFKNGNDLFEYVFTFIKDVGEENEDSVIAKTYLNHKEEDENGKKVVVRYPVLLTLLDKKQKVVVDTGVF